LQSFVFSISSFPFSTPFCHLLQWKPEDLPSHVLFVHADAKPAIDHEFRGTFTEAETDVAEKAKAQAAEETAWLRQEVERLKAELAARRGGTSQKASGDAVSARLASEETRRILLPAPETEGPVEPGARWVFDSVGGRVNALTLSFFRVDLLCRTDGSITQRNLHWPPSDQLLCLF
jgi:hypothetical protein